MVEKMENIMKYESPSVTRVGSASGLIQGVGPKKDQGIAPGNGQAMLSSLEEPTVADLGPASARIQGALGRFNDSGLNKMEHPVSGSLE